MKSFNRCLDTRHSRQLGRWHAGVSLSLPGKCYRANFLHRSVVANFKSLFFTLLRLPSLFIETFCLKSFSFVIFYFVLFISLNHPFHQYIFFSSNFFLLNSLFIKLSTARLFLHPRIFSKSNFFLWTVGLPSGIAIFLISTSYILCD